MRWDDIRFFLALARHGTLMGAAEKLGVSYTTVARRIRSLEHKLDVILFEQTSGGYLLTHEGILALRDAEAMETGSDNISRKLKGSHTKVEGELTVTFPLSFGTELILPHLKNFQIKYPAIRLNVIAGPEVLNIGGSQIADIALRASPAPPENLIGRKMAKLAYGVYGARDYIKKLENNESPEYLSSTVQDKALLKQLYKKYPNIRTNIHFNTLEMLKTGLESGNGLGILPRYMGDRSQALERLPVLLPDRNWYLWLLYHPNYKQSLRLKAFISFFTDKIKAARPLLEGKEL